LRIRIRERNVCRDGVVDHAAAVAVICSSSEATGEVG